MFSLRNPRCDLCRYVSDPLTLGGVLDPEKRKRSPTDGAGSPGSKESPSGRMETARPQVLLNVPHLQLPHHTAARGARHFDTRSLNEENFIASIGVYAAPLPRVCMLAVRCSQPIHWEKDPKPTLSGCNIPNILTCFLLFAKNKQKKRLSLSILV